MKNEIKFKTADELVAFMLERKKQSKIETEAFAKTKEFQEIKKRLQEKTNAAIATASSK